MPLQSLFHVLYVSIYILIYSSHCETRSRVCVYGVVVENDFLEHSVT